MSLFNLIFGSEVQEDVGGGAELVELLDVRGGGDEEVSGFFPGRDSSVKDFDILVAELFRLPGG
jgi:hypothetical protein